MAKDELIDSWLLNSSKSGSRSAQVAKESINRSKSRFETIDETTGLPYGWENQGSPVDSETIAGTPFIEQSVSLELDTALGKNKNRNRLFLVLGILLGAIAIITTIIIVTPNDNNVKTLQSNNPLVNFQEVVSRPLYEDISIPKIRPVEIFTNQVGNIQTSTGHVFSVAGATIDGNANIKSAYYSSEYTLVGSFETLDKTVSVFYTENLVKNSLFFDAAEYYELGVKNNKDYSALVVRFINNKPERVLTISNQNGSGWFLVIPPSFSKNDIQDLYNRISAT